MDTQSVEYKGYTILPILHCDGDEMWWGGYEISKNGKALRVREEIALGFLYKDAARQDSIEHAKLEIDNIA